MIDISCRAVGPDSSDLPKIDICASSVRTSVPSLETIDVTLRIRVCIVLYGRIIYH